MLDETREYLKDPDDPYRLLDETRSLGLTVCRGTDVTLVCPADGFEEIANPFLQEGGDDEEPPEILLSVMRLKHLACMHTKRAVTSRGGNAPSPHPEAASATALTVGGLRISTSFGISSTFIRFSSAPGARARPPPPASAP